MSPYSVEPLRVLLRERVGSICLKMSWVTHSASGPDGVCIQRCPLEYVTVVPTNPVLALPKAMPPIPDIVTPVAFPPSVTQPPPPISTFMHRPSPTPHVQLYHVYPCETMVNEKELMANTYSNVGWHYRAHREPRWLSTTMTSPSMTFSFCVSLAYFSLYKDLPHPLPVTSSP